ncbi:MAG: hypothetical protein RIM84_20470 [Alphaproteobacteria bacterium]
MAIILALLVCTSGQQAVAHGDDGQAAGTELLPPAESAPASRADALRMLAELRDLRAPTNPTNGPLSAADIAALAPPASAAATVLPSLRQSARQTAQRRFDPTGPPIAAG